MLENKLITFCCRLLSKLSNLFTLFDLHVLANGRELLAVLRYADLRFPGYGELRVLSPEHVLETAAVLREGGVSQVYLREGVVVSPGGHHFLLQKQRRVFFYQLLGALWDHLRVRLVATQIKQNTAVSTLYEITLIQVEEQLALFLVQGCCRLGARSDTGE